jgi:hypothetical protein
MSFQFFGWCEWDKTFTTFLMEKNLNNTHIGTSWKTNVWHTTLEMRDRIFLLHYRMSFEAFNILVLELTHFLQSSCLNPIRPQLEIRKFVAIVIY